MPWRYKNYLDARGVWPRRRLAPHGPAPRLIDRELQMDVQTATRTGLLGSVPSKELPALIEQAGLGYEREEVRIDGIQQRATFFLGATGLTTSLVLVNGGLLYGSNAVSPDWVRDLVGVLLLLAAVLLFVAGMAALDATTITFDRVLPNSAGQILRRIELNKEDAARRDLLAALLLAAQRAGVIGNWKLQKLVRARLTFGLAVMLVLVAGSTVLLAALFHGSPAAGHGISLGINW